jgi:hypothetical protein
MGLPALSDPGARSAVGRVQVPARSFDSPSEWKNVEFDWDNPASGTQPAIPRCITPRPWPPYLVKQDEDDGQDG